jgi:glycosyltransferase involved in cell wall biosynthesis
MKTVLSIIDWYLPGYRAGGTLKAFANQVSHFNEEYDFKIITRDTDYMETIPYDTVVSNNWNDVGKNTSVFYLSSDKINYAYLSKLFKKTQFDTIYIHGVYSLWFSIMPIYFAKKNNAKKIVISAHGMFGKHAFSVKSRKKKLFTSMAKLFGLYKNVFFHAANEDEATDIRNAIGDTAKVIVAEEMPANQELEIWKQRKKTVGDLKLVYIGRIAPEKNTLYAIECLKNCTKGNIIYDIYGPVYEESYWQKCNEVINTLPDNVKVNYKGSLDGNKVLSTLAEYHLMFLPTTGENFGHTILESFMSATPVLISSNTPWKQLKTKGIGWDIALDSKDNFSKTIDEVANMDQHQFDEMSKKSLEYADVFIHDDKLKKQNDLLFNPDK